MPTTRPRTAKQNGQEVPDFGIYKDQPWSEEDKGLAAMISRMDGDVGRILKLLADLGIDDRTVVMFSSDNGPHNEGGQDSQRFNSSGPLRGMKRDLYEGGIRVPLIVRWPGTTPANQVTDHVAYFGDFMATAGDLAGVQIPAGLDSISLYPTITGQPSSQQAADYLYWEFYEQGSRQAVRAGKWKAIREPMFNGDTQALRRHGRPGRKDERRRKEPGDCPETRATHGPGAHASSQLAGQVTLLAEQRCRIQ